MDQGARVLQMASPVVALEVAEAEFERFVEAMDLDMDTARMDADERKSYADLRGILTRAIQRGTLSIDDKGQPVYQLADQSITFYEPTGATFMSMDGKKSGHDIAKLYGLLGDMTRQPEKLFAKMAQRDLKVCRTICTIFLG